MRPLTRRYKLALVLEILWVYGRVRFWLWRTEYTDAVGRLRGSRAPGSGLHPAIEQALSVRLGRAVARTVSLLPTDNRCLMRSLVLTTVLARRGIPSAVIIAARTEPEFAAHAWVEYNGMALIRPGDAAFQRLTEI